MRSILELSTILPPPGAWDSHVHVIDEDSFPFHPQHPYRPRKADWLDLKAFHESLGIDHPCIVAVSVYHTDNSSILDALTHFKGRARAVACVDPSSVSEAELSSLHKAGVRTIRLNLRTRGDTLDKVAIRRAADRIRPLGWALQLFITLDQVLELAPLVPELGVPVVIDHLGAPDPSKGPGRQQPGFAALLSLLKAGKTWVKLSGAYRFPDLVDLDDYVTTILEAAPNRVVWASDWPHTGSVEMNPGGDRKKVQNYRKVDDLGWIQRCRDWCRRVGGEMEGEERLARLIWVDNPRELWQYDDGDTKLV